MRVLREVDRDRRNGGTCEAAGLVTGFRRARGRARGAGRAVGRLAQDEAMDGKTVRFECVFEHIEHFAACWRDAFGCDELGGEVDSPAHLASSGS